MGAARQPSGGPLGLGRGSRVFVQGSAVVDPGATVGVGTKVGHFCHILAGAVIGEGCTLGQNVFVDSGVVVGRDVRIQNSVSLYRGTIVEDSVFIGPSAVLTNARRPRAELDRCEAFAQTRLRRGCTVGANTTVISPVTIGRYALVGAGAVVTHDVVDYELVLGAPARAVGFVSRHGHRLTLDAVGRARCPRSGWHYVLREGRLECEDHPEDAPLPGSPVEEASPLGGGAGG